jgi:ribonuclease BN (tRNA processing enzyme)
MVYDPHERPSRSYLKFWGTRGSIPVSGVRYATFGGNTCCLEIRRPDALVIIDAGTGIRALGDALLASSANEIHLFFGHTHWDHLIGLPFFAPLYESRFTVHIYTQCGTHMKDAITRVLGPDYFPVRYEDICCKLEFHEVSPGSPIQIDDISVDTTLCNHPGGALGFLIETAGKRIGYVTDNEFLKGYLESPQEAAAKLFEPYSAFIDFFRNIDLFIHEAQYTPQIYREKVGWGHTSISNATLLARECNIRRWWVTHHDPIADDIELRQRQRLHWTVLQDMKLDCNLNFAYDGLMLNL